MAQGDLAYSNVALSAHTDGTYWTEPPGLQAFHLLSDPAGCRGGESLLVDGWAAADRLRAVRPDLFAAMLEIPIATHASGGGTTLIRPSRRHRVFEHDVDGELIIRWNPDDRAPFAHPDGPAPTLPIDGRQVSHVEAFYRASRAWVDELRRPEAEYWSPYEPGRVVSAAASLDTAAALNHCALSLRESTRAPRSFGLRGRAPDMWRLPTHGRLYVPAGT